MKKLQIFALFISLFLPVIVFAQSGWITQNSPTNEDLNDIAVLHDYIT